MTGVSVPVARPSNPSCPLGALPPTNTPDDYLRLQFDAGDVGAKRIVGLLACQRDPLLRSLTTRIASARPAPIATVPTQKGKGTATPGQKKGKREKGTGSNTPAPSAGQSGACTPNGIAVNGGHALMADQESLPDGQGGAGRLWEVELEDTVIFPEGGGQLSDTGTLILFAGSPDVAPPEEGQDRDQREVHLKVEMCIRRKLDSVHLVRVPMQWEGALSDVAERTAAVRLEVDWERRVDQMTIHTAQHLLSAVLDTLNLPTLSWAMHAHPALECPYVELPRQLTWAEAQGVEARCNGLIREERRVWVEVSRQHERDVPRDEAGEADGERESRGLPKDYAGGVIRHCCIDGTDRNACCGTQLPHLGLITHLHIIPPSLSSTATAPSLSATKLFFTAGPRALRYFTESSRELSLASQALGCAREETAKRAARAEEIRKDNATQAEVLRKELARMVAAESVSGAGGEQGGVIWIHRSSLATHDFEFLGNVAQQIQLLPQRQPRAGHEGFAGAEADRGEKKEEKEKEEERVILLSSALEGQPGALVLVLSKDDAAAKGLKDEVSRALDELSLPTDGTSTSPAPGGKRVKGGGAKGRYMCKVNDKFGKREKEAVERVVQGFRRRLKS